MRISFDLDDTLVIYGDEAEVEPNAVPWPWRWWVRDPMRLGGPGLIRDLRRAGCEVWVYTTSMRSESSVRRWLGWYGTRIDGFVNQSLHRRTMQRLDLPNPPTKLPSAFGIDLHVDDLPGVAVEGARHGFDVVILDPADRDWCRTVLDAVARRAASPEAAAGSSESSERSPS